MGAFWIVWTILHALITPLKAGVFGLIALPMTLVFTLAGFGIWIFLMYQAYQQKLFRLPIVGRFAAQHAGVRLGCGFHFAGLKRREINEQAGKTRA
jgi:uncharacterized membrane protein